MLFSGQKLSSNGAIPTGTGLFGGNTKLSQGTIQQAGISKEYNDKKQKQEEIKKQKEYYEKQAKESAAIAKELSSPIGFAKAFVGEFAKNTGDLAKTVAQGTIQLPERLYQTFEEMRANSLLSTGKPSTGRYESGKRTGIVGEIYGKEPVQSYFQTGRDVGEAMKKSNNEVIRNASVAAPLIGPALAALDLVGIAKAGLPITKQVVGTATKLAKNEIEPTTKAIVASLLNKPTNKLTAAVNDAIKTVEKSPELKINAPKGTTFTPGAPMKPAELKTNVHIPGANTYARLTEEQAQKLKNEIKVIPFTKTDMPHLTSGTQILGKTETTLKDIADQSPNMAKAFEKAGIDVNAPQVSAIPEQRVSSAATKLEQETGVPITEKATYTATSYKENKVTADELVTNNKDEAYKALNDTENVSMAKRQEIYKSLATKAKKENNVDDVMRLARSKPLTERSEAAQTLGQAGYMVDHNDPAQIIADINKVKEKVAAGRSKVKPTVQVKKDIKTIKSNIKAPDKKSWASFIDELRCK